MQNKDFKDAIKQFMHDNSLNVLDRFKLPSHNYLSVSFFFNDKLRLKTIYDRDGLTENPAAEFVVEIINGGYEIELASEINKLSIPELNIDDVEVLTKEELEFLVKKEIKEQEERRLRFKEISNKLNTVIQDALQFLYED